MKFLKEKRKDNKEKHGPRLPAVAKERLRRAGALVLALVLFMGAAFSDLPEGILSGLFSGLTAQANTTSIHGDNVYSSSGDDIVVGEFNRSADEDIWFFTATDTKQDVFCLNSGASLHFSKDTYKYYTVKASDYGNATAARAVIWYTKHSGGYSMDLNGNGYSFGTWSFTADEVHALIQAYIWGGSTVVDKVLKNYCKVYDGSPAQTQVIGLVRNKIVSEIEATSRTGYIYVYTLYNCGKGSSAAHQTLIGWSDDGIPEEPKEPVYAYLEDDASVPVSPETVELTIKKKDGTSGNLIDEASFTLTMDGTTVTSSMVTVTHGSVSGNTFTTEDGYITIEYAGSSNGTITEHFGKYWYVVDDGGKPIPSNYYKSEAEARSAMNKEISEWKASQNTSSTTKHTWVATEISAPVGHELTSETVTVVTTGSQNKNMTFSDTRKYVANVTLKKICDPDFATIAANSNLSLAGAQYTIYAAETVYDPAYNDTAHVLYKKDQAITTITTNSSGVAKLSANSTLLPYGYNYYLKETKAPAGWEIDDSVYYFDTSGTTITSEETPVFGYVEIYKNYEDYTGGSLALYPEINATFDIYKVENGTETRVETLTTKTNGSKYGYAISGELPYGTYVLRQTSAGDGAEDTAFMPDYTFTISETEQVVSITYTNPDISVKIRVTKTKTTEDPAIDLYVSAAENDAVFYIVDESLLSGLTMESLNKMTASERKAAIEAKVSSDDIISVTTGYVYEPVSKTYTAGTDGVAETAVDAGATYWIIQVKGEAGYAVANVKSVEVPAGDTSYHDVSFDDKEYIVRVELTKYMAKYDASSKYSYKSGTEEPEEGALFYIIDQSSLSNADNPQTLESLTQMNAASRLNWADNYGTVLGSFVTDSDGNGTAWFSKSDLSSKGWFILQVGGAEGYALMDAITDTQWAANNTPYGYAKFYSYTDGDADQITVYTVDSSVIDPEQEAYLAVEKVYETSNNSFDPEEGAVFYVYSMSGDLTIYYFTVDVNGVTFTGSKSDDTSEDPKAPAGYTLNKAQAFTYTTEDGVVTMHASIIMTDAPVFGEIEVEKDTDGLSQASTDGFAWTATTPVEGAVYAIYAYTEMFKNDKSLIGGDGTTYQKYLWDSTWANIDDKDTDPGYFSEK